MPAEWGAGLSGKMLPARLRGTSWPVSATRAPRSTLPCLDALRLAWRSSCSDPWRHRLPRGSTGESGPAYDDESDGGGTDGYESGWGAMVADRGRGAEDDDGGVVAAVAKLAGCVESDGERYGESEADEGECDSGVVDPDTAFGGGRWTWEGGRGMATLGEARTPFAPIGSTTEVEGEDAAEDERRCVGWKYGSCADKPMRLSTGRFSCRSQATPFNLAKSEVARCNGHAPAAYVGSALPCIFH